MKRPSSARRDFSILLAENIHPAAVKILSEEGFTVKSLAGPLSERELLDEAHDVQILGIRSKTRVTESFLEQAPRLLAVGCFCIGTNQVDLDAGRRRGVAVFNAPFSNTRSVAEMVMAEIVMLARRIPDRSRLCHEGGWDKSAAGSFEVRGKTLGIIGYGHIGSQLSVLAESFGMRVLFDDIVPRMPIGNSQQTGQRADLFRESHFVTLHVPETVRTRGMIGAAELAQMRPGAFLINASRGSVVDLQALRESLNSGHLAGAAVDVFPEEPAGKGSPFVSPLQNIPNVILTPHIGGSTEEAQENIGLEVAGNLVKFLNNGSTMSCVNFPKVDLPIQHNCHRILNVHRNIPGVLKEINGILSAVGANIIGQYLATDSEIGYLIVDIDREVASRVRDEVKRLPASIRTRVLS